MPRKIERKFTFVKHGEENYLYMEGAQEWRNKFFRSSEFRALQESKIKDIFKIPESDARFPVRQDSKRTQLPGTETRDWKKCLNGISMSNYRRIQDLKRGDRVILPNDSQIHILNKGIVPKGVLIIARTGTQEITGYNALQVRTYVDLKLYEFILPHHIRSLHLVETETSLMSKQPPNIPLPGYFTLRHAYLIDIELESPESEDPELKPKFPMYRFELAFLAENGTASIQKFLCSETVHESVNRLEVSWNVGYPARAANFAAANKWVVWLLKYIPSTLSSQSRHIETRWIEAETYQILGWSTSGVLATGSDSVGAIQTSELTAGTKMYEDDLYRVLGQQVVPRPPKPPKL
ncbi:hypothetical protein TWF594_011147 [Orbilia oligospora]|nr:hypothetical protein TWF594_011147 [Orbilia oligospora]